MYTQCTHIWTNQSKSHRLALRRASNALLITTAGKNLAAHAAARPCAVSAVHVFPASNLRMDTEKRRCL